MSQKLSREDLIKKQEEMQANAQRKILEQQVDDLKMRAQYWKALYEVRDYTLKAAALESNYNEYLRAEQEKQAKAEEEYKLTMEKLQKELEAQQNKNGEGIAPEPQAEELVESKTE